VRLFADIERFILLKWISVLLDILKGTKIEGVLAMWRGYVVCELSHDEARVVLVTELPPPLSGTTEWSPTGGSRYPLRIPGNARGLFGSLEEIMDAVGVYRDGYTGLDNHRLLLRAVNRVRCGRSDLEEVYFTLSPARLRLLEMEVFEANEAGAWTGYTGCLDDPGCAEVLRRGC
jgi:hypothetical protein